MRFSITDAMELPTYPVLRRAARQHPDRYQPVNGAGFFAVRADGHVVELVFGPRGGVVREVRRGRIGG